MMSWMGVYTVRGNREARDHHANQHTHINREQRLSLLVVDVPPPL